MASPRLCELLSSLANCEINERTFSIGAPQVIDKTKTFVLVIPRNSTRMLGRMTIEYDRVDLSSTAKFVMPWRGETDTHQVAQRADLFSHFVYRLKVKNSSFSVPRRLHLKKSDIVFAPIIAATNLTDVVLTASPESDFFIGSFTVTLRR